MIFPLSVHFNLYKIRAAVTEESEGSRQQIQRHNSDKYCVWASYLYVTCITVLVETKKRSRHKYGYTRLCV